MDASTILDSLNAAQRAAVTAEADVVQILAPPGSGKTKTLTARVAWQLAEFRYRPWNVLCLTFTIKSAREMKERIARLVGEDLGSKIVLGTFHSVCRRYLVRYGHLIGIKRGFGIADSADTLNTIKRILKRHKGSLDANSVRSRISRAKARYAGYEGLRAGKASQSAKGSNMLLLMPDFLAVFEEYEAHLRSCNLLDYDDLLLRTVDLLRAHPEVVSNVEAVLVDEFQDTNAVQFDLMQLFAAARSRVTTVGDPDQSIYGWRCAEVANLTKMQGLYPHTLVLNLEHNYRSSGAILAAALEVIQQDRQRPNKPLEPTHGHGTRPVLRRLPDARDEADWIVAEIQRCVQLSAGLLKHSDFAVLLRSAALSRQIESSLGAAGLPYRMVGGARFFDRVEVKLLLNYLRVAAHPQNDEAFSVIINVPPRRIGESSIKKLLEEARTAGSSVFDFVLARSLGKTSSSTKLLKSAEQSLSALLSMIQTVRQKLADEPQFRPHSVLDFVMKRLEFKEYLKKAYPDDHETRWANVEELIAQAADAPFADETAEDDDALPAIDGVAQGNTSSRAEDALTKFLANVALSTELQKDDGEAEDGTPTVQERITLSTIHAAKGLEWPVVIVPAAYQGSIPHSRSEDHDEERRLLYVAMTRAQGLLYLSWPQRNTFGDDTNESDFLEGRSLAKLLSDKGPPLDPADMASLAAILGRPAPADEALAAARLAAPQLDDDEWPADGSSKRRSALLPPTRSLLPAKRPWLDHAQSHAAAAHLGTVTPSFTTAGAHLQHARSSGRAGTGDVGEHERGAKQQLPPKKSRAGARGQGKLGDLWALVNDEGAADAETTAAPRHEAAGACGARPLANVSANVARGPGPAAQGRSQGCGYAGRQASTLPPPPLQDPVHAVSRKGLGRPAVRHEGEAQAKRRADWILLSSSPPPGEQHTQGEPKQQQKQWREDGPGQCDAAAASGRGCGQGDTSMAAGTQAAATLHRTSMEQMQARRTLGIRRSGSTAGGGMRPFKAPSMCPSMHGRRQ